jgi:hypothetical protein
MAVPGCRNWLAGLIAALGPRAAAENPGLGLAIAGAPARAAAR